MTKAELLQIAKPILFNAEMVGGIQDDRKGVTRRAIKPQPKNNEIIVKCDDVFLLATNDEDMQKSTGGDFVGVVKREIKPKYNVGDILYVRETWGCYEKDWRDAYYFVYKADYPNDAKGYWYEPEQINWCDLPKWRPSIHMPADVARIFLRVTDVRAEQLQDITDEQAIKEGTQFFTPSYRHKLFKSIWLNGMCRDCKHANPFELKGCAGFGRDIKLLENCGCVFGFGLRDDNESLEPARLRFFAYIEHLAYKALDFAFTYKANPWVWVYEFERIEDNNEHV